MFYKMTASGNDFVVLDGRFTGPERWPPVQVRAICDRRNGVGGDGLVLLTPAAPEAVRMIYWNSDGSRGAMCGNAALCAGRLAVALEMTPPGEVCLLTDVGTVLVRTAAQGDEAEINVPDVDPPREFTAAGLVAGERWMTCATVGVPHLVIRVDDVETVDINARGRTLRFHPGLGAGGANVNFVGPASDTDSLWLIRTYERGVEGETLACGTGTVAAAVTLGYRGEARLPVTFRSRGGPLLRVQAQLQPSSASGVWLGGQGRLVFRGVWEGI